MDKKYYYNLVSCKPIYYENLCFYPVSYEVIMDLFGEDYFEFAMLPFCITAEYVKDTFNIETTDDKIFEDTILRIKELLENTCQILSLFCKCGKITCSNNSLHLYDSNDEKFIFDITSENFNDIAEILRIINCKSKIKIEKPPANMSERQRDIWEKLQAGRKRDADKNRLHIYDIIKICEFGGDYHIPLHEMKEWTLWKLMDSYKTIAGIKDYNDNLEIGIASYDLSAISKDKCWIKRFMIRD